MAKPVIKFYAAPFEVNGYKGYRIQLEAQNGVYDLDFCKEVVNEKRLAMSPEELLHALEMTGEVASAKVAEDGRPRGITKLIKWNRFGYGTLESPSSPWNASCRALIKPQLLAEATKLIDATFQNVTEGIGVRLNDVTWLGAQTVQNVLKIGADFSANGSHMEFIEGDTAVLKIGEVEYALENTSSDVSHAVFAFPETLAEVEPGTQAMFIMKSRGGVADGQVYTVKKLVTIIAGDGPRGPAIKKVVSQTTGNAGEWKVVRDTLTITTARATGEDAEIKLELYDKDGVTRKGDMPMTDGNVIERVDANTFKMTLATNTSEYPDIAWSNTNDYIRRLTVTTATGSASFDLMPAVG